MGVAAVRIPTPIPVFKDLVSFHFEDGETTHTHTHTHMGTSFSMSLWTRWLGLSQFWKEACGLFKLIPSLQATCMSASFAGLVRGPRASSGPNLIFKSDQKHEKRAEMGPESMVWAENRSRSMPGPLLSVWDGSNPLQGDVPGHPGPKKSKSMPQNH